MTKALDTPVLTLHLLFTTARGNAALVVFLEKTKIATASWLLQQELLESSKRQRQNEKQVTGRQHKQQCTKQMNTAADSTEL
jgi:hypothetical protein